MQQADAAKAIVAELIEVVWRRGDLDALGDFWTDDCINHAAPEGQQHGLPALRAYHEGFAEFFAAFSDFTIDLLQQIAEADRVATSILAHGLHTGPFLGRAPTNRAIDLITIRIDRIANGKIAEHWSVADLASLLAQIDADTPTS